GIRIALLRHELALPAAETRQRPHLLEERLRERLTLEATLREERVRGLDQLRTVAGRYVAQEPREALEGELREVSVDERAPPKPQHRAPRLSQLTSGGAR